MNTNFPSVTLHFVYSLNYCRLRVLKNHEPLARKLLEVHRAQFVEPDASTEWHDVDTRLLLDLVCDALPPLLYPHLPLKEPAVKAAVERAGFRSLPNFPYPRLECAGLRGAVEEGRRQLHGTTPPR